MVLTTSAESSPLKPSSNSLVKLISQSAESIVLVSFQLYYYTAREVPKLPFIFADILTSKEIQVFGLTSF